jgi:hypothetical protein
MLSGEWLGPCQASSTRSPPDLEGVPVGERDLRGRSRRVVVAQQQSAGLLVPGADDVPVEQRGRVLGGEPVVDGDDLDAGPPADLRGQAGGLEGVPQNVHAAQRGGVRFRRL